MADDSEAPVHRGRGVPHGVEPADVPIEATRCPGCGAKPTHQSVASHRLSQSGYLHDDVRLDCENDDCDEGWTLGIPIGKPEPEFYDDLVCGCGTVARVHRVKVVTEERVQLHLKCPRCFAFFKTIRETDDGGIALVGNPDITGDTSDATPYGYVRDDDGDLRATHAGVRGDGDGHAVVGTEKPRVRRDLAADVEATEKTDE